MYILSYFRTRDSIPLCVLKTLEKKYDFIMMKMEGFMRPIREIEAWEKNEDDNISLSAKENIIFQFIK